MSKQVKLWPSNGGDFIKVLSDDVERMKSIGWVDKQPTAKKKPAPKVEDQEHGKP